jgi:hypothetical protein
VSIILVIVEAIAAPACRRRTGQETPSTEAGTIAASTSAVRTALATTKASYVGEWTTRSGKSSLLIRADGTLRFARDEAGTRESIDGPIEAFSGDDIEVRSGALVTIRVTRPPHFVGAFGGHLEMSARGLDFERFP